MSATTAYGVNPTTQLTVSPRTLLPASMNALNGRTSTFSPSWRSEASRLYASATMIAKTMMGTTALLVHAAARFCGKRPTMVSVTVGTSLAS